jgi:hypothetical protein
MIPAISLRRAFSDPKLLGGVLQGPSWRGWRTLLLAIMGEQLDPADIPLFKELTGRDKPPSKPVEEFIGVIGRRGGKSRAISAIVTYIAACCAHPSLVAGERGVVLVIAPDQRQADICLDYIHANFEHSPMLSQLVESRAARVLRLNNGVDVEVRSSDFRRLRGPTYIAVVGDEIAFWMSDYSTNPDTEILNAVRPGLATTRGPMFLISSPYARRGELWRLFTRYFGKPGPILVARAPSRSMNPSLPQFVVDRAIERDPHAAAAEYLAEFRRDIEAFVPLEAVQACVSPSVRERPPRTHITYSAFADPSGGSADAFALAIGHTEAQQDLVVIDALREIPAPFSPETAVGDWPRYSNRTASHPSVGIVTPVNGRENNSPSLVFYTNQAPNLNHNSISISSH